MGVCLLVVLGVVLMMKWVNEMRYRRRKELPPGSMGFPFFGETTKFVTQGPSFMKTQRARSVVSFNFFYFLFIFKRSWVFY